MNGPNSVRWLLLALAAIPLLAPRPATAQCRLCAAPTTIVDVTDKDAVSLVLEVITRLDFDRLILLNEGNGSATLRPDGSTRAAGSIGSVSGRAMVGELLIRGAPGRVIRLDLPGSIELIGLKGGTIRVDSLESDLKSMPTLDSNGELRVRIGGELSLSGELDGDFRGDVAVFVDYL